MISHDFRGFQQISEFLYENSNHMLFKRDFLPETRSILVFIPDKNDFIGTPFSITPPA